MCTVIYEAIALSVFEMLCSFSINFFFKSQKAVFDEKFEQIVQREYDIDDKVSPAVVDASLFCSRHNLETVIICDNKGEARSSCYG